MCNYFVLQITHEYNNVYLLFTVTLHPIGGGTRGARRAIAPRLYLKLEGLSSPSISVFALIRLE